MPVDLTPPRWVADHIAHCQRVLRLEAWTISFRLEYVIDGDEHIHGQVTLSPHLWRARILLRGDIEDSPWWHKVIWHEMLHVSHSRIDEAVEDVLIPALGTGGGTGTAMASLAYGKQLEPFIEQMARIFLKLAPFVPEDETEEAEPEEAENAPAVALEPLPIPETGIDVALAACRQTMPPNAENAEPSNHDGDPLK